MQTDKSGAVYFVIAIALVILTFLGWAILAANGIDPLELWTVHN